MTPDLYHRGQIDKTPEPPANTVGMDWLTITFKNAANAEAVRTHLARVCEGEAEVGHGRHNYTHSERWPCGATLYTGHKDSGAMLNLSGEACGILGGSLVFDLMRALLPLGRCTRIDLACDYYGPSAANLVQDALTSCRAREGVGFRKYYPFGVGDMDAPVSSEEEITGIRLGSPTSPRFVRLYDKGVEQGTQSRGHWVRWEAQLRDDHADKSARLILASGDDWGSMARSIALHAVEFLSEPDETHNDRRHPVPWYAHLVEDTLNIRTRLEPSTTTLRGFLDYADRSVFRTIKAACQNAGLPFDKFIALLARDTQPTDSTWKNPTVFLLSDHLKALDLPV